MNITITITEKEARAIAAIVPESRVAEEADDVVGSEAR